MNNEENQSLNQVSQNTDQNLQPQQIISPNSAPVTPVSAPNGYQPTSTVINTQPNITQEQAPQVFVPQPQAVMSSNLPLNSRKRKSPVAISIIVMIVLFVLAAGGYILITHNSKAGNLAYDHTVKGSQPNSNATTNSSPTSSQSNQSDIAFGATATDKTFQVKLLSTMLNPTVTGSKPDAGTEYLEADFQVTSIANKNNYAFNILYVPSMLPIGDSYGDIQFGPVDNRAGTTSPITFKNIPAKQVQISGKNSAEGYTIPSDGSAKTVSVYTLFEIKPGDKGQIVWQGLDGGKYHFLTQ